jgi:ABC-2 type transport system ATP-binding protein
MAVCRNTFGVRKGEVFGLLGPNGAGKSTSFGMLAMQLPISSGSAELMGHEID